MLTISFRIRFGLEFNETLSGYERRLALDLFELYRLNTLTNILQW